MLQMVGDFFTKPLQGSLFKTFRDAIMGRTHMNTLSASPVTSVEERVGEPEQPASTVCDDASKGDDTSNDSNSDSETWADIARKPPSQVTRSMLQEKNNDWILIDSRRSKSNKRSKRMKATRLASSVTGFERSFSRNNPIE